MRDEIRDINRRVNDVNNPNNLNRLINLNNPYNRLNNINRIQNQRIVFNSQYFQIRLHRPVRQNQRFNEENASYELRLRNNLPQDPQALQDILYACIERLLQMSFDNQNNRMVRLAIYHDD